MPDSSSSTSSSSTAPGSSGSRSTFNRAQLEDLELAEDIAAEARKAAYATALAARDISAAAITALAQLCLDARRKTTSRWRSWEWTHMLGADHQFDYEAHSLWKGKSNRLGLSAKARPRFSVSGFN